MKCICKKYNIPIEYEIGNDYIQISFVYIDLHLITIPICINGQTLPFLDSIAIMEVESFIEEYEFQKKYQNIKDLGGTWDE